jgi:hypothetical protein
MASPSEFVRSKVDVRGTFAIASAPPNELAKARGVDGCTAFTGQLLRVFRDGIQNHDEVLTLDAVYRQVKEHLAEGYPEPQRANWQDADQVGIVVNRAYNPETIAGANSLVSAAQIAKQRANHAAGNWSLLFFAVVVSGAFILGATSFLLRRLQGPGIDGQQHSTEAKDDVRPRSTEAAAPSGKPGTDDSGIFSGHILDLINNPVDGVLVELIDPDTGQPVAPPVTSVAGMYSIRVPPEVRLERETVTLRFSKDGMEPRVFERLPQTGGTYNIRVP